MTVKKHKAPRLRYRINGGSFVIESAEGDRIQIDEIELAESASSVKDERQRKNRRLRKKS